MRTARLAVLTAALALASMAQAATTTARDAAPEVLQVSAIDHVGINVPDIDSAVKLFTDLIGAKVISDIRPGAIPAEWKTQFRWHPSSELERFVMLQLEGGAKVELFQYKGPKISHVQPHEDDIGASHFALRTTDMTRSLAMIKAKGLKVLNEPITNPDGVQWFYFLTPWGSQIELVSQAAKSS
ncbi:VOC family protein [Pseudomonas asplenii]|uniref:Catechol 2,3-dioxygenase n=1 Tax=Pseudomonas asplenii TaxID=53407 RepID=A0A1H6NSZ0_9PSED|nr:VOC family protein [Pseudomonas fuscovaginae]SEI19532.1 Catechol 2,3-dioxygenase [Pseudomonas fuscovaginae]